MYLIHPRKQKLYQLYKRIPEQKFQLEFNLQQFALYTLFQL